jgi:hypothetical protein
MPPYLTYFDMLKTFMVYIMYNYGTIYTMYYTGHELAGAAEPTQQQVSYVCVCVCEYVFVQESVPVYVHTYVFMCACMCVFGQDCVFVFA